jgi:hypothetical protein
LFYLSTPIHDININERQAADESHAVAKFKELSKALLMSANIHAFTPLGYGSTGHFKIPTDMHIAQRG